MTLRSFLNASLRSVSLVLVLGHLGLVALYVGPVNPLKIQLASVLDGWVGTFFPQDWRLFAPDPITHDPILLARCFTTTDQGGWYDVSTPLWRASQHNRFSAYDRLARPQMGAVEQHLSGGSFAEAWLAACRKGSDDACKEFDARVREARRLAAPLLQKIGSAFCNDIGRARFTRVALRVRRREVVPWSRRRGPTHHEDEYDLGDYAIDRQVPPLGLYEAR